MIFVCVGPFKGLLYIGLKNVGVVSGEAAAVRNFGSNNHAGGATLGDLLTAQLEGRE